MRFPALLLILTLPWVGPLPAAAPPQPVAGAASPAELRQELAGFLAQPRFEPALWGVKVISVGSGHTLFEHHADRRMSPASNCKLYTGALALVRLGEDYRIHTPLRATAGVDPAGVLPGDLVVCGRGDPSWTCADRTGDFRAVFAPFVDALRRAGVRTIRGDIVADATWLRCAPQGASWTADDLGEGFGAEISALSLWDNFVELRVTPGLAAGQPGQLELLMPLTGLVLENQITTVAAGTARKLRVQRLPGETRVQVYGELPAGGASELVEVPVPQPARWFAAGLAEALRQAGITVTGGPRAVLWPSAPVAARVTVGEVVSPPLRTMVAAFMKQSQNLETDLIFAHLGELRRTAAVPEWMRSDELAVAVLQEFLREFALRPDEVRFDEGSGLSRNNLATAASFVRLLEFMAGRPAGAAFLASLPVAGVDGSLQHRLQGPPTEGKIQAKTGGLRWAATLSGYVTTAGGERLAFSLLLNRHAPADGRKARDELDEIARLLARYRGHEE